MNQEINQILEFGRFATREKSKAFHLKEELDKKSKESPRIEGDKKYLTEWRVGIVIRDRIVLDVDSHDTKNLKNILDFYQNLLNTSFKVLKTSNGYHLIQNQKYPDRDTWIYYACLVLYPTLRKDFKELYIQKVNEFFEMLKEEREGKNYTKTQLQQLAKDFPGRFKKTGLYRVPDNIEFDILHAVNAIVREKYVLRISKKNKDDRIEEVKI